jgi:hypothetical protein
MGDTPHLHEGISKTDGYRRPPLAIQGYSLLTGTGLPGNSNFQTGPLLRSTERRFMTCVDDPALALAAEPHDREEAEDDCRPPRIGHS